MLLLVVPLLVTLLLLMDRLVLQLLGMQLVATPTSY